ncbi:unnamed protein product [Prunus armeniaca]|uniref:Methyltransferase type 11 domain-containing protein n=1 Tax=Prunus armeniaca TaxID=36596 RepID=A0A6J5X5T1_PRUAR|nr:unnamed protein product [Prunus armeniaca]
MGKSSGAAPGSRDWTQIYAIYGLDQWQTILFLLFHAVLFTILSLLYLTYFDFITLFFHRLLPIGSARFRRRLHRLCHGPLRPLPLLASAHFLHSSLPLHYDVVQRMVNSVNDWSTVKHALDLGCGRGILLNAVATQMKKEGSSGRVVGLDRSKMTSLSSTLRTAKIEGVGEYVTCREGDPRRLPFGDGYFDVVVSAVFVHTVGKEYGHRTVEASAERMRVVGEMVRVLKPGGVGVVWDLLHVPEYVRRLQELKMEDIRVSERVTAFMVSSHIVSFRKPSQHVVGPGEVRLDWRC